MFVCHLLPGLWAGAAGAGFWFLSTREVELTWSYRLDIEDIGHTYNPALGGADIELQ